MTQHSRDRCALILFLMTQSILQYASSYSKHYGIEQ